MAAAHLAETGRQDRLAGVHPAGHRARQDAGRARGRARSATAAAQAAIAASRRRGYLDGRALAEVFAWLRPSDLIWNYWVNNYLLGKKPPAFDVLFWNADTTRMAAGAARATSSTSRMDNALTRPGGHTMLGAPVDLSGHRRLLHRRRASPTTSRPWQNCYRSTQLLGGETAGSCCPPAATSPRW